MSRANPIGVNHIKKTHGIDFCVVTFWSFFVDTFYVVQRFLSKFLFTFLWCPKPDLRPLKTQKKTMKIKILGLACSSAFYTFYDCANLILQSLHRF